VVQWGVNQEMLSVIVENTTDQEIRSAHALITARDSRGTIVSSISGPPGALCCTIVELPPHQTFGLFADLGPGAVRTANVEVDLSEVSVGVPPDGDHKITAYGSQLHRQGHMTYVQTYLAADAEFGPYVAAQAVLVGPAGKRLVAVISGRFYCLFPGRRLSITMQLFHPVPQGTQIEKVTVFSIPSDLVAVTAALPRCVSR
jgi:hypothetical protein